MRVVQSPSFWNDLRRIADFFRGEKAGKTAERFARAVDATIEFIAKFPDLGNPWESPDPDLAELRYRIVKKFKHHLVVYRNHKTHVVILRIFHTSQKIEELLKD